jgi:hypothetical protein
MALQWELGQLVICKPQQRYVYSFVFLRRAKTTVAVLGHELSYILGRNSNKLKGLR